MIAEKPIRYDTTLCVARVNDIGGGRGQLIDGHGNTKLIENRSG